jgi:hypothetical protein
MSDLVEVWASVPEYEGIYEVSNFGRFAVIKQDGRVFRKLNSKTHYLSVSCKSVNGKKPKTFYLHTLVAKLFIGNRPDGMVIRHLDGNRFNNKVSNLSYGTPEQNYEDTRNHKVHSGENNGRAIINSNSAKAIKNLIKHGVDKKLLSESFGVSLGTIYAINSGRNWNEV